MRTSGDHEPGYCWIFTVQFGMNASTVKPLLVNETAQPQSADDLYDEPQTAAEATEQFVSFRLSDEWYAVNLRAVREIVKVSQIAFLPSAPAHIAGAINLRGNIVSVTDPKRLFGLPAAAATPRSRIVVIENATAETGLLVDEVGVVLTLPVNQLEPPLATLDLSQTAYLQHVCRSEDRLLGILHADKLLGTASPGENEK